MKTRKIVSMILAAAMMLSLTGCYATVDEKTGTLQLQVKVDELTTQDLDDFAKAVSETEASDILSPAENEAELEYWSEDSEVAASIREYVEMATDETSDGFIPVEDRLAVFDLDGTIIGELYPSYFEYMMFIHRALHDDTFEAPDDMREFAEALEQGVYGGKMPEGHERLHAKYAGQSYAGMTIEEMKEYTREFMESPADGFTNLKKGDAFYLPMVSLVKYLTANDFTVYIVSGSDRTLVRALIKDKLPVPENRVIGMSYTMVATGQEDTDGLTYVYTSDDDVILGGDLIIKTIKMNKVSEIALEIGKVPVLSFGNTSGDQSMAQYTVNNTEYEGRAYMLMCDDLIREHGNMDKANAMKQMCNECGFIPVSMRDDFTTIYGDDVEAVPYEGVELSEALEPAA
ncbi:MAG: haloacid dehalogenase-like hydrolase [Lachnospiraceae bacterium]|nr:haloacid dehalogenase-like hydrolase [Lachnospiraceae bacterium]